MIDGDWKLIISKGKKALYNLAGEEPERKNYASEKPEVLKRLVKMYEAWLEEKERQFYSEGKIVFDKFSEIALPFPCTIAL